MSTVTAQQWSLLSASLAQSLGEAQADTLMSLLPLPNEGGYATKVDLASVKTEVAELRAELKIEIAELRSELKTDIAELRSEMAIGFAAVESRFAGVDSRFAGVDSQFAQVDSRFAQIDSRFAQVDSRFAQVDSRFAQVDSRFAELRLQVRNDTRALIATQSAFLLTAVGVALAIARLVV